jgi:hypothetical protein
MDFNLFYNQHINKTPKELENPQVTINSLDDRFKKILSMAPKQKVIVNFFRDYVDVWKQKNRDSVNKKAFNKK